MRKAKQQSPDSDTSSSEKKPRFYTHCPECGRPMDVDQEDTKWAKKFLEDLGHDVERIGEDLWAIDRWSSKAQYKISPTLVAYARRIQEEGSENKHRRKRKGVDSTAVKAHGRGKGKKSSRNGRVSKTRLQVKHAVSGDNLESQPISKTETRSVRSGRKTRSDKGKKRVRR